MSCFLCREVVFFYYLVNLPLLEQKSYCKTERQSFTSSDWGKNLVNTAIIFVLVELAGKLVDGDFRAERLEDVLN